MRSQTTHNNLTSWLAALAWPALALASAGVFAHGGRGTEIDTTCKALNGTTPYAANGTTGTTRCALCHQDNRSVRHEPEWTWVQAGPGPAGQNNFCFVQGIITAPAADVAVSKGGTVDLAARGFSPTKGVGAVVFNWNFSDGRAALTGSPQTAVPLPAPGNLIVTLKTTDAAAAGDPTPDQRTITVSGAATVANADSYTVQSGNTLTLPAPGVLSNDSGTGKLTAALVDNVKQGVLTLNANGGFDYRPNAGFTGADSFSYKASNGVLSSAAASVTLNVTAAQTVANADRYFVQPGGSLTIAAPGVLANDGGTGALSARLVRNSAQGVLSLNADGSFVYTPRAAFTGSDSFTYTASNSAGSSPPAKVSIDIGSCTDKDNDGYSPEGGNCGPIDCNDSLAGVNPGAKEICANQIDDDCNGLADQKDPACNGADCLGKLIGNQVNIDSAAWSQDKLKVSGSKATAGLSVTVYDALSGAALGASLVDSGGNWTFEKAIVGSANAPCRVRVDSNGASGVRVVSGGSADCSSKNGAPAACGVDTPNLNECLLNWAERSYTSLFAPAAQKTLVSGIYTYRHYAQSNVYLGISSVDNHVYYLGPDGVLSDLGATSYWKPIAGCP